MNRKRQEMHISFLNDIQQSRQVSSYGTLKYQSSQDLSLEAVSAEVLDSRAIEATRLAFRYRKKVTFIEIMAIPALFSGSVHHDMHGDAKSQSDSAQWDVVRDELRSSAPEGVRFNLVRRVPSGTQLEHWTPETTRFLLEQALPGGATFRHELALPAHQPSSRSASQLGLILVLGSSERGWPNRYLFGQLAGERLRAILRFVLEAQGAYVTKLGAILPASEAITQGVCDWLTLEIELSGHDTWGLHLDSADADRRWIHLARAGEPSSLLRVPLRSHLIGSTGLSKIASHIGTLVAHHTEVLQ